MTTCASCSFCIFLILIAQEGTGVWSVRDTINLPSDFIPRGFPEFALVLGARS
jgi:hypothetical protein